MTGFVSCLGIGARVGGIYVPVGGVLGSACSQQRQRSFEVGKARSAVTNVKGQKIR